MIDTIVAPATALGRSALAMVRIDGPRSAEILRRLSDGMPEARVATRVQLHHAGDVLDDCVAVRFVAPHSFTGNDLVELTLHGNPLLVERVIAACIAHGARLAEPGEFTERAVLNGKMDLVQAESIADLINARTALQAKLSLSNLEGMLSRRAQGIRESLLHVMSRLEAALDFSEEGYEFISRGDARLRLELALSELRVIAETYRRGRATTSGLSAVILGRPNAGKSTLLNRLVGSDRAIVTPIPGTTRDIVRETIEIGGLPVTLADTAGLRESSDVVESIGIERAREAARQAELIIYLVDATAGLTAGDELELAVACGTDGTDRMDVTDRGQGTPCLIVYTKTDLADAPAGEMGVSAVSDAGIAQLLGRLDGMVRELYAAPEGALVNERQRMAVVEAEQAVRAAVESLTAGLDEQMVLVDLYRAANALAALTGAIAREDVLAEIFSKFCIGK